MNTIPELSAENKSLRIRWVMIGFAFLATVLNYIHRLSFNYLSADGELRKLIPDDAFGYMGTAFFIAYMISNAFSGRSEEHTSELQSQSNLVCRLLLEKKKKT